MRVLTLIFKNMFRHKLRTSLTVLGIAIAVSAFGLLRTVVTAWNANVEASAADRLITRQAVSFIFPLPLAYREQIARTEGIENITFANWFGGVYIDKKQFFARLAVDAETFLDVYPEFLVPQDQLEAFKRDRSGCIIGEALAQGYNLKIGDVMPMEGDIYPGHWEFTVRGIYKPRDKITDPTNMLFHWQYLEERLRVEWPQRAGYVGWYTVKIRNPQDAAAISEQIDQLFKNSPAATKTETERAFSLGFMASVSAVFTAMNVMSFVIIGIILLVLGNTMIMSARERIREYAILKTLGFTAKHIVGLIAGESLAIALLGGVIGLAFSFPMVSGFEAALPRGWFPIFHLETITLLLACAAAIIVGILAAIFPIHRAVKSRIVDGLRQIG